LDYLVERLIEDHYVIEGSPGGILRKADSCRGIGLGITIDKKSGLFSGGKASG